MASLDEFLAQRHKTLTRELAEVRHRLSSIETEIDQIERAAAAANVSLAISETTTKIETQVHRLPINAPQTMKEAAVEVLTEATGGMTTTEILEFVNDKLGTSYPRSSLSPQLSRLKGDGVVNREDGRWVLAIGRTAPSSNESGASDDAPESADR